MNKAPIVTGICLGLSLMLLGAENAPMAYVTEVGRTISVGGESVELDAAVRFSATEASAEYADWYADFAVTFDRKVAKGGIALYGQIGDWNEFPAIEYDGPVYLLKTMGLGEFVNYAALLAMREFPCGVKLLNKSLNGTRVDIELRLTDPNDAGNVVTIARYSRKLVLPKSPNWFDARIASYRSWPIDAAKAFRGAWRAIDGLLEDSAQVNTDGVLSIDTKELDFVLGHPRKLGVSSSRMTVSADVSFGVYDFDRLPTIDPQWKGAVIRVAESGGEAYYGLAQDGVSNVWRRLEGPAPTDGMVIFLMELRSRAAKPVVNYTINGFDYKLNGEKNIPIVASDAVSSVVFGGEGALTFLAGATESGLSMQLK